jgi:hypothetical protein
LSAREAESGRNEAEEGERVRAGLKRELGDVGCDVSRLINPLTRVSGGCGEDGADRRGRSASEGETGSGTEARAREGETGSGADRSGPQCREREREGPRKESSTDRSGPPGRGREGEGVRRQELVLMGRMAKRGRELGYFLFFFYSEFLIPFLFIFSFEFKSNQTTNSNLNISNICLKQKVKSKLSMMQHFMSPLGF